MKNIKFKSIILLLAMMASFSCQDKLEDLYQDPDGFSKAQADAAGVSVLAGYFANECSQGLLFRGDYGAMYHICRSGDRVMGFGVQLPYLVPESGVSYSLRDVDATSDWGSKAFNQTIFNKLTTDWIKQILWGQYEYNKMAEGDRTTMDILYMNLLHAIKAYAYQRATDLYDEVPYFETGSAGALDHEMAKYKGQEEIYPVIIKELGEISNYLNTLDLTSSEEASFALQDVLFGGNVEKWEGFVNSLRLRCAMTVSEVKPDLTKSVISELNGRPLMSAYNDVAGISDLMVIAVKDLPTGLGIGRAFYENGYVFRAPKMLLDDVMHCTPVEKSKEINGETLSYFEGDNHEEGLKNGTVDPRVSYMFSPDLLGRYIGVPSAWDDRSDKNSYLNKLLRTYYINDPIMSDINVTSITIDLYGNSVKLDLDDDAKTDLTKRDADLLKKIRNSSCNNMDDTEYEFGKYGLFTAEYNIRPYFRFDNRMPRISSVETELYLSEAAIRGFGTLNGSAREHYKKAIELSCEYWYRVNNDNPYSLSTTPYFPKICDKERIDNDKPAEEYNASAYAEYAATLFDKMSDKEKVNELYKQLFLHYNFLGYEICFTNARRLIKYLGDNPANIHELFKWKERNFYPPTLSSSDPEGWSIVSGHDDTDLPVWFTGRTEKWKNTLE